MEITDNSNVVLALKHWCDENLTDGKSYRGSIPIGEPIASCRTQEEQDARKGVLTYQDGTACSASHAFADVYLLEDGSYDVYMDSDSGCSQGESGIYGPDVEVTHHENLAQVVHYLDGYSGHDPNNCGELINYLVDELPKNYWEGKIETRVGYTRKYGECQVPDLEKTLESEELCGRIREHVSYRNERYLKSHKLDKQTEPIAIQSEIVVTSISSEEVAIAPKATIYIIHHSSYENCNMIFLSREKAEAEIAKIKAQNKSEHDRYAVLNDYSDEGDGYDSEEDGKWTILEVKEGEHFDADFNNF